MCATQSHSLWHEIERNTPLRSHHCHAQKTWSQPVVDDITPVDATEKEKVPTVYLLVKIGERSNLVGLKKL